MKTPRIAFILAGFQVASLQFRLVSGGVTEPLAPSPRAARVLFVISHDCPISNAYVPEMNRICRDYRARNVDFFAVYSETDTSIAAERAHANAFGFAFPGIADPKLLLAAKVGATVTPEAVVLSAKGVVLYRGRIDDSYPSIGIRRTEPTTHDLRKALDQILSGHPVTNPRTTPIGCFIPR